ncbi:PTS transporter subunit EIIA, partial [Enterococcus faecalis]
LLFVCPNGMGTSSFVSAKIRRILPDIDSIETASVDKLNRLDLFDVDLIISTVDIPKQIRPVVRISPMVTARDMKRIMNHYIDLVIDNEQINIEGSIAEKVKPLISSNVYFDHFDSKEAAIRFLVDQQQFENEESKQRFLYSIFEREEIQSTYLENGFAIPHGNPNVVKQTSVAVLIA